MVGPANCPLNFKCRELSQQIFLYTRDVSVDPSVCEFMHTASVKLRVQEELTRTIGAAPGRRPTVWTVLSAFAGAWVLSMGLFSLGPQTLRAAWSQGGGGIFILGVLGLICFFVLKAVSYNLTRRRNFRTWSVLIAPVVLVAAGVLLRNLQMAPAAALLDPLSESSVEAFEQARRATRPLAVMAWCLAGSYLLATSFAWRKRSKRMGSMSFQIAIMSALAGWAAIIWGLVGTT